MPGTIVDYHDLRSGLIRAPVRIYLDSNFLIATYAGRWHAPDLLLFLFSHRTKLYVSTLALDEAWWVILRESVKRDRNVRLTGNYLKAHRDLLRHYYPELERFTNKVLAWPNAVFVAMHRPRASSTVVRALIRQSLDLLNSEQLAPRDAFHLAILQGLGITDVVTEDRDFDDVDGLTLYRFH